MHELALCDAMLKMVRDISREQSLEGVRSITVRVGTLSGVVHLSGEQTAFVRHGDVVGRVSTLLFLLLSAILLVRLFVPGKRG